MSEDEYLEELFFPHNRRESRKERKIASNTDRSQYKKSDQEKRLKQKKQILRGERARVLSIVGNQVSLACGDETLQAVLKGRLKKSRSREKNLIVVGDFVRFERQADGLSVIHQVEERKSSLYRSDNLSRRKRHLIAANVDIVFITFSVLAPPLKPFIIDRYLIAAKQGNMEPVLVVNKMDLLQDTRFSEEEIVEQEAMVNELSSAYPELDIFFVSALEKESLAPIVDKMKNRASVFSGQSGVGKSCLINQLTGRKLKTGKVVHKTRKGAHTTTQGMLFPLDCGGFCVDTPGIKSFGLWQLEKQEIEGFFEQIHDLSANCQFSDCLHLEEPVCAIKEALEDGTLSPLRFQSYLALMQEIDEKHLGR